MQFRRLGSAGVSVSELSFGSWVTYGRQVDVDAAVAVMRAATDAGINFFDNAEVYASGKSEEVMGAALKKLGLRRSSYLVSTKFYWGLHDGPNEKNTLNRKYLRQAIDGSLERLGLPYVDLVYCHRPDPNTPLEETVRAMHDMVESGKALYWGTSEWDAARIREATRIATALGLHKPQMEQPEYNLLHRHRVEIEYAPLYPGGSDDLGLGTTTWSPLASGLLSGKYQGGIPEGSRAALKGYGWLATQAKDEGKLGAIERVLPIARDLGCTPAQLAIAWCLKNPHVSTVILGASRLEQLTENLGALTVVPKLTEEIIKRLDEATGRADLAAE
jgi:voltage-dependent potassium channel beta subunit